MEIKRIQILTLVILLGCILEANSQQITYRSANKDADFFAVYKPASKPYKGLLIIVPGLGETPQGVSEQTQLPHEAAKKGILTLIPFLKDATNSLGMSKESQNALDEFIQFARKQFETDKLFLGGFSAGGTMAIKYSERANDDPKLSKPSAVFAIDPPLDFERLYNTLKRNIRLAETGNIPTVAPLLIEKIELEFGGNPKERIVNYQMESPYSFSDTSQYAVKKLINMPLRIICEPDIQFAIDKYRHDYYSMNAVDGAAMINELQRLGNKRAVFVATKDKGFNRVTQRKTLHAWNIGDEETIDWLLDQ